jgi:hypothetical protein
MCQSAIRNSKFRKFKQNPTVNALLYLPEPGEAGSLSNLNHIRIDGATPFITAMDYMEGDGNYGLSDLIHVTVTFTAPVAVSGEPRLFFNTGDLNI